MATVINVPRDQRFALLGQGIGNTVGSVLRARREKAEADALLTALSQAGKLEGTVTGDLLKGLNAQDGLQSPADILSAIKAGTSLDAIIAKGQKKFTVYSDSGRPLGQVTADQFDPVTMRTQKQEDERIRIAAEKRATARESAIDTRELQQEAARNEREAREEEARSQRDRRQRNIDQRLTELRAEDREGKRNERELLEQAQKEVRAQEREQARFERNKTAGLETTLAAEGRAEAAKKRAEERGITRKLAAEKRALTAQLNKEQRQALASQKENVRKEGLIDAYTEAGEPLGKIQASSFDPATMNTDRQDAQRIKDSVTAQSIRDTLENAGLQNNARNRSKARNFGKAKAIARRDIVTTIPSTKFGTDYNFAVLAESQKAPFLSALRRADELLDAQLKDPDKTSLDPGLAAEQAYGEFADKIQQAVEKQNTIDRIQGEEEARLKAAEPSVLGSLQDSIQNMFGGGSDASTESPPGFVNAGTFRGARVDLPVTLNNPTTTEDQLKASKYLQDTYKMTEIEAYLILTGGNP